MKKKIIKLILAIVSLSIFSSASANLDFSSSMERYVNTTNWTLNVFWECETAVNKLKLKVKPDTTTSPVYEIEIDCKSDGSFSHELDFCASQELLSMSVWVLELSISQTGFSSVKQRVIKNPFDLDACIKWSSPDPRALVLKDDNRVCVWDCYKKDESIDKGDTKEKEEIKEKPALPKVVIPKLPVFPTDDNEKNKDEKNDDEVIEVILENWNKFSHKKLVCPILEEIQANMKKDLSTNFKDISGSMYVQEIASLENTSSWIVVWTTKNTFEAKRNITKSEWLWMVLKSHCYNLSWNTRENWQERVVWIWVRESIIEDSNIEINANITKDEAFRIIIRAGKINTWKNNSFDAMKHIWVIDEKENDKNSNLKRDEAANILIKILKSYKVK